MGSHNLSSAVNQQERPDLEEWAVGFVDGEGCFSISVVRHQGLRLGWQVQHEFSVSQNESSRAALELLVGLFGCGTIIENHRKDDHRDAGPAFARALPASLPSQHSHPHWHRLAQKSSTFSLVHGNHVPL